MPSFFSTALILLGETNFIVGALANTTFTTELGFAMELSSRLSPLIALISKCLNTQFTSVFLPFHWELVNVQIFHSELLNLRCLSPIMSFKQHENLKDILIFKYYAEFWKTIFQRFWILSFSWFWCDSIYKWPQLIKSLFGKELLFIFGYIFVVPLWSVYQSFSCLIFSPSLMHISMVSFWNLGGEKLILVCIFFNRTELKSLFFPCPKKGRDHVGYINHSLFHYAPQNVAIS